MKKIIIIVLVVLALVGFALYFFWPKAPEIIYREFTVEVGDMRVSISASGTVSPANRLEIKPPISGRIEDIFVKEGQLVFKGMTMALMSSTERAALLDAARAKGEAEINEWKELYKATPVVAPQTGIIIARKIEAGQTVTAQDALLILSDKLIVRANIDETDIGQVENGLDAQIILDAYPKKSLAARVTHLAYEAVTVNNVTMYEVEITPESEPEYMRSGMTANVNILVADKKDIPLIPIEALKNTQGHLSVRKNIGPVGERVREEIVSVEVGASDGKRVEIISGLSVGDRILIETPLGGGKQIRPSGSTGMRKAR